MSNIYICGCVKNCGIFLPYIFDNMLKISKLFNNYKILIAYDESKDDSLNILTEMKLIYNMEIILNNHKSYINTKNISDARNSIINFMIKEDDDSYKYFIMMDCDDVCSKPMDIDILNKYLSRDDWDGLSFNLNDYYDIWALSIDDYILSCWHWGQKSNEVVNIMRSYVKNKLLNNPSDLIECYSAFNGFSIYKKDKFLNCRYNHELNNVLLYINAYQIKKNISVIDCPFNYEKLEECEHRYFHLESIYKNQAKIRISTDKLFIDDHESMCTFVSSRGLLKSCDIKSSNPISSIRQLINYNFQDLHDGCTIYVSTDAMVEFLQIFHQFKYRIVLVTGDCDSEIYNDLFHNKDSFINFIESPQIIHWYAQNCISKHPKLSCIPIGLDYHTLATNNNHEWGGRISPLKQEEELKSIKRSSKPFWERQIKCFANFQYLLNTRYGLTERTNAMINIDKKLIYYVDKSTRIITWNKQIEYAFVVSPKGNGIDCHRTWEALCLGCIPIILESDMNNLFDDLPVLIIKDWQDITLNLLTDTIHNFKNKTFNYEKLTLKYWIQKINNKV